MVSRRLQFLEDLRNNCFEGRDYNLQQPPLLDTNNATSEEKDAIRDETVPEPDVSGSQSQSTASEIRGTMCGGREDVFLESGVMGSQIQSTTSDIGGAMCNEGEDVFLEKSGVMGGQGRMASEVRRAISGGEDVFHEEIDLESSETGGQIQPMTAEIGRGISGREDGFHEEIASESSPTGGQILPMTSEIGRAITGGNVFHEEIDLQTGASGGKSRPITSTSEIIMNVSQSDADCGTSQEAVAWLEEMTNQENKCLHQQSSLADKCKSPQASCSGINPHSGHRVFNEDNLTMDESSLSSLFSSDSVDDATWLPAISQSSSDNDLSEGAAGAVIHIDTNFQQEDTININEEERLNTRKRKCQPEKWKKNLRKKRKNLGQAYVNAKNIEVPARVMKDRCQENKCKFQCKEITHEQRNQLFTKYWSLGDLMLQKNYVSKCMQKTNVKYRRVNTESRPRAVNFAYGFEIDGSYFRVCKKFFMSTLSIGDKFVRIVQMKTKDNFVQKDQRGTHPNHKQISEEIKTNIRNYINEIPKIESHYLRNQTTRVFISGEKTLAELHRDYVSQSISKNIDYGNYHTFRNIFNTEFNIGFFTPKKDQCAFCESYKNASDKESLRSEFENHRREVDLSRAEKKNDAALAKSGECLTACYDLQAVLPTPCGEISSFYYKRRLSTLNFTIFDLGKGLGHCYLWYEGIANRGPNEIGTCLNEYLRKNSNGKNIVFYSDNCSGQNKNKFILALYLYAVHKYNIPVITHKFLITGQSQNEGDNMHSLIEKQRKRVLKGGPIYVPAQWITVVQSAKKNGPPFKINELSTNEIIDLKQLCSMMGTNFNIDEDGNKIAWNQIKVLQVQKENPFSFKAKTSFEGSFKTINLRRRVRGPLNELNALELKKAYTSAPGITATKKKDLMSLCQSNAIKPQYHDFYHSLIVGNSFPNTELDDE